MTSRVYIEGDPGKPINLRLFDADTGRQLDDVAEVQITVSATKQMVDLRRVNSTANERCELVPRPPVYWAGMKLHHVHLERLVSPAGASRTRYQADVNELEVGEHGDLILKPTGYRAVQEVDDFVLAQAVDPSHILSDMAQRAIYEALRGGVVEPMMRATGYTGPLPAPKKEPRKTECAECKGTGYVILFNGRSPCSQGCKP